jgi:hypothetical protein
MEYQNNWKYFGSFPWHMPLRVGWDVRKDGADGFVNLD